jgi:hypothetical protein
MWQLCQPLTSQKHFPKIVLFVLLFEVFFGPPLSKKTQTNAGIRAFGKEEDAVY